MDLFDDGNKQYFDPKVSYDSTLASLKLKFDERWRNMEPSPSNNLEDYIVLATLGEGAFGKVKFVKSKLTQKYCAVKLLLKDKIVNIKNVKHVFSEKQVLRSIEFPFLIRLEFSSKDNEYLYMGLTYCAGGELYGYMDKVKKFNEATARFYAAQVFLAFEYLHHMSIVYRDLKPENVLITHDGYVKIADMGMAKRIDGRTYTLCGTPEYFAPELVKTKAYGFSVDWWTFGVFIFELNIGHTPFAHSNDMEIYERIVKVNYKMPSSFGPQLRDLVHNILQADVSKRLGSMTNGPKDIKYHNWFNGVDWFALLNKEVRPSYVPKLDNIEDLSNFDRITDKSKKVKSAKNRHAEIFEEF